MASYSNVSRRFVAATRRLQELLKALLNIPSPIMRSNKLNRNLRSIDLIGYGVPISQHNRVGPDSHKANGDIVHVREGFHSFSVKFISETL